MSNDIEKIKEIANQMPEGPEKQLALQAYSNLKTFEVMADSFESLIDRREQTNGSNRNHNE